jgi:hypothetical protein
MIIDPSKKRNRGDLINLNQKRTNQITFFFLLFLAAASSSSSSFYLFLFIYFPSNGLWERRYSGSGGNLFEKLKTTHERQPTGKSPDLSLFV